MHRYVPDCLGCYRAQETVHLCRMISSVTGVCGDSGQKAGERAAGVPVDGSGVVGGVRI